MEQSEINGRFVLVGAILSVVGYLVSVGYAHGMVVMLESFLLVRSISYLIAFALLCGLGLRALITKTQSKVLPLLVVFIVGVTFSYAIAQIILNVVSRFDTVSMQLLTR